MNATVTVLRLQEKKENRRSASRPELKLLKAAPAIQQLEHSKDVTYSIRDGAVFEKKNGVGERRLGRLAEVCKTDYEAARQVKFGNHFYPKIREHRLFSIQVSVLSEGCMKHHSGRNPDKVLIVDPKPEPKPFSGFTPSPPSCIYVRKREGKR